MALTKKEIDEVLAKKPEKRYNYFVKKVVAEEEVWGLADPEGWLLLEVDDDNTEAMAVFPNPEFAELFQKAGDFGDFEVSVLDLSEFMEWLDDFEEQKMMAAVFPTPDFQSAVIPPMRLKADIQAEFDKEKE
jgi:Protein of unknown function (DUF2750)